MYAIFQNYRLVTLKKNYDEASELELKLKGSSVYEVNSLDELNNVMDCKKDQHRISMKAKFQEEMASLARSGSELSKD